MRDAEVIARKLDLHFPFELLENDVRVPFVTGTFKNAIVLPMSVLEIPASERAMILRHELAHVKRRDSWFHLIRALGCALHWFNPLVWFAGSQLRLSEERAVDDDVLRDGCSTIGYAEMLARFALARPGAPEVALAMARVSTVRGRVACLLDPKQKRAVPHWMFKMIVSVGMAGTVFLLGSLRAQEVDSSPLPVESSANESVVLVFVVDPDGWAKASTSTDGKVLTAQDVLKKAGLSLNEEDVAIYDQELSRVLVQTTHRHAEPVKAYFAKDFGAYPRSSFRVKLACEFVKITKVTAPARFGWLTKGGFGLAAILRDEEKATVFRGIEESDAAETTVAPDVLTHSGQTASLEVGSTEKEEDAKAGQLLVVRATESEGMVRLEVGYGGAGQERRVTTTVTLEDNATAVIVTKDGPNETQLAFLKATLIHPAFQSSIE